MDDKIKVFVFSNQMAEKALDAVENGLKLDLNRYLGADAEEDKDQDYYPQFAQDIRAEARDMAVHYELFYCLEVSIRTLSKYPPAKPGALICEPLKAA